MILGRNVVYSEENRHADRRGDRLIGARGGDKTNLEFTEKA